MYRLYVRSHIDGKYHPLHMCKIALGITAAVDRLYYGLFKLIHTFGCLSECVRV